MICLTNLERLEAKIREACPELIGTKKTFPPGQITPVFEAVNHPIRLEHVLRALSEKDQFVVDDMGRFYEYFGEGNMGSDALIDYDLTQPLANQKPEVWDSLVKLLFEKSND